LARVPGVTTWWQHEQTPKGWRHVEGVFAPFRRRQTGAVRVRRVVVTLGTAEYSFRRLVDRLIEVMPNDVEVFWQVGETDVSDLSIDAHVYVDGAELRRRIEDADVVVTHAGAGSLLQCLEAGQIPVYVARVERYGEQVDDHQCELAIWADQADLAVVADASKVTWNDLQRAASSTAVTVGSSDIRLEEPMS